MDKLLKFVFVARRILLQSIPAFTNMMNEIYVKKK